MEGTSERLSPSPDGRSLESGRVHVFPTSDASFHRAVLAAIAEVDGSGSPPLQQLEDTLRRDYPAVRVVEQLPFGAVGGRLVLYVFRDGSVQPQPGDGPGTPRYVPLGVAMQREMARSVLARRRSAALLDDGREALERSRRIRQRTGHIVGEAV
jgi:hypothetical protein